MGPYLSGTAVEFLVREPSLEKLEGRDQRTSPRTFDTIRILPKISIVGSEQDAEMYV